jgi:hypothetical protein
MRLHRRSDGPRGGGPGTAARRKFSKFQTVILSCDVSVLAVHAAKDELKFLFGRTWPESWGPNVTSLMRDNTYPASHLNHFPPAMPPCLLLLYRY